MRSDWVQQCWNVALTKAVAVQEGGAEWPIKERRQNIGGKNLFNTCTIIAMRLCTHSQPSAAKRKV